MASKKCSALAIKAIEKKWKLDQPMATCPQCHGRLNVVENFYTCPKCNRDWCKTNHGIYYWEQNTPNDPIGEWVEWENDFKSMKVQFT
jgi:hypothetical protein